MCREPKYAPPPKLHLSLGSDLSQISTMAAGPFSLDVWRYFILPYCEIPTLLRVNWTNAALRRICNDPKFVVHWQTTAWFLHRRLCPCDRNIFYLNVTKYLEFSWDCNGWEDEVDTITSVWAADRVLRTVGRATPMYFSAYRDILRVGVIRPEERDEFQEGLLRVGMDDQVIPMPRMLYQSVEDADFGISLRIRYRLDDESYEEYQRRLFWGYFHEVPDNTEPIMEYTDKIRVGAGYRSPSVDQVRAYMEHCAFWNEDPFDPAAEDPLCEGYHAAQWARKLMNDSAVGIQKYPLELCLRRTDLQGRAQRVGVDYIDYAFLPINPIRPGQAIRDDTDLMYHDGPVYFSGVRYENEQGDFVPWALSTLAMLQGTYVHFWIHGVHWWLRNVDEYMRSLAQEVEMDMSPSNLAVRWRSLVQKMFCGEEFPTREMHAAPRNPREREREQAAIDFMFNAHFTLQNKRMSDFVEHVEAGIQYWAWPNRGSDYLSPLIPDRNPGTAGHRTEAELVQHLHEYMHILTYIVQFARYIGPLTNPTTDMSRARCLNLYLCTATSLLMFAPGWRRTYTWQPSETGTSAGSRIPALNLHHNHRYQRYLDFLNRRTLYYVWPHDKRRGEAQEEEELVTKRFKDEGAVHAQPCHATAIHLNYKG